MYESEAHGATFASLDRSTSNTIRLLGFVDDTKNQVNHFGQISPPIIEELTNIME